MNEVKIGQYIGEMFDGVDVVTVEGGDNFYFYNPDDSVSPDHRFPIITLVTGDRYDQFSDLDRPGVFRLNIGIGKETFRARFGKPQLPGSGEGEPDAGAASAFDFTALDQVMPHPVYGRMYWVCVLNPSDETFAREVQPLLAEAYALAVGKHK